MNNTNTLTTSRLLLISLLVGLVMAIVTRWSFIVASQDLLYFQIRGVYTYPKPKEFDRRNLGREVFGVGGLPFSTYARCTIELQGTLPAPTCEGISRVGRFSMVLNTLSWSIIVCLLLRPLAKSQE